MITFITSVIVSSSFWFVRYIVTEGFKVDLSNVHCHVPNCTIRIPTMSNVLLVCAGYILFDPICCSQFLYRRRRNLTSTGESIVEYNGPLKALVLRDDKNALKDFGDILAVARSQAKRILRTDSNVKVVDLIRVPYGWIAVFETSE